jgi:hypothetical protein
MMESRNPAALLTVGTDLVQVRGAVANPARIGRLRYELDSAAVQLAGRKGKTGANLPLVTSIHADYFSAARVPGG